VPVVVLVRDDDLPVPAGHQAGRAGQDVHEYLLFVGFGAGEVESEGGHVATFVKSYASYVNDAIVQANQAGDVTAVLDTLNGFKSDLAGADQWARDAGLG
jgi:hypothetical protein